MTQKAMPKDAGSTAHMSLQDSTIQGAMSQKKWLMTRELQKERRPVRAAGTAMAEKPQPGAQGQVAREPGHHDAAVAPQQADGQVAVVGHGHQQEVLDAAQREDEVHLHSAA